MFFHDVFVNQRDFALFCEGYMLMVNGRCRWSLERMSSETIIVVD